MCGLAGIISSNKTSFNVNHFNLLGTLNDERGGDSCGIFIDGEVKYGINDKKLFRSFMCDLKYPKTSSIALLHCRKASAGYTVNLYQSQPVIIKENDEIKFVLMHNGTINNINALASKYISNINITGQSDSQILAQIIYHKGYDVLKEYTGCAVLIIVDYRFNTPKILFFKGSSCYNEANSKSERPLYFMYNEDKFYFSSMYASLYCINNTQNIYDFPVNKLYELKDNKLLFIKNIDRTKLKKEVNVGVSYYGGYYNYSYSYGYNRINYNKATGLYMLNNKPAHGLINVYPSGYVADGKYYSGTVVSLPFFNGRLLFNKSCYDFLNSISDLFEEDVLESLCPEIVDYFSYSPIIIKGSLTIVNGKFNYIQYTEGSYVTLFMNGDRVTVKNGVSTKNYIYPNVALDEYLAAVNKTFFNFDDLESQVLKIISNKLINLNDIQ